MIKKVLIVSIIFLAIGLIGMIVQKSHALSVKDHVYRIDRLE